MHGRLPMTQVTNRPYIGDIVKGILYLVLGLEQVGDGLNGIAVDEVVSVFGWLE